MVDNDSLYISWDVFWYFKRVVFFKKNLLVLWLFQDLWQSYSKQYSDKDYYKII